MKTNLPRPRELPATGLFKSIFALALFLPLTALYRVQGLGFISLFPTWRIMDIFFIVLTGYLLLSSGYERRFIQAFLLCCVAIVLLFSAQKVSAAGINHYAISRLIGYLPIFMLMPVFQILAISVGAITIERLVMFMVMFSIGFQFFQLVLHYSGIAPYFSLFNDSIILAESNFERNIGLFWGAPGGMAESGHLAMLVGPLASILVISRAYRGERLPITFICIVVLSLLLTVSGGGVLQLMFFLAVLLVASFKTDKKIFNSVAMFGVIFLLVGAVLYKLNFFTSIQDMISLKIELNKYGESMRQQGALVMKEAWGMSLVGGMGLYETMYENIDSNSLFYSLGYSHGIIGVATLAIVLFCILFFIIKSNAWLYVIPCVACWVHLFFAYGTIAWPFPWIICGLALGGAELRRPTFFKHKNAFFHQHAR